MKRVARVDSARLGIERLYEAGIVARGRYFAGDQIVRPGARGAGSHEAELWTHIRMSYQNDVHSLFFLVVRNKEVATQLFYKREERYLQWPKLQRY